MNRSVARELPEHAGRQEPDQAAAAGRAAIHLQESRPALFEGQPFTRASDEMRDERRDMGFVSDERNLVFTSNRSDATF